MPPESNPAASSASRARLARLQAIVVRRARLVARLGGIEEERLGKEVLAAFQVRPTPGDEDPFAVRAWARETAMAIGGDGIAYQHALCVARAGGSAERAGVSPEDVGQEVRRRWFTQPPNAFKTVLGLKKWTGTTAKNYIIECARHLKMVRRNSERFPDDLANAGRAEPPQDPERVLADGYDFPKQVLLVAARLGESASVLVRMYWLLVESSLTGWPGTSSKELAQELGTTAEYIYKMRLVLRRRLRELKRLGETEWDIRPAAPSRRPPDGDSQ